MPVIHGIILFRDTSIFHAREQAENQRLQEAFEEADSASRAKTAFMNRMSHDIRTLDRPDAAAVPILAMTAQASDECAQSCHQAGMNGRLVKPLDAKKLAKSIREAVQNKQ